MDYETLHLLRAARETGLLDALLTEAATAADAAATAGVDERAAELTVEALLAEGYLTRVGDAVGHGPTSRRESEALPSPRSLRSRGPRSQARVGEVEPTNELLGFLAAADLRSVGALPDALDELDALAALPETIATGEPPESGDRRDRLGARLAGDEATVRAAVTAAVRAAPDADHSLVVDGAPGRIATEFAARGLDVTAADDPDALEAAAQLLSREPVETVAVPEGDPLPGEFDLVVSADATRRRTPAENRAFVARMADALADGGRVVLIERLWGRSADAVPAAVAAYARDGGRVYDERAIASWFDAAGLEAPSISDVPGTESFAVVGGRAHPSDE